MNINQIQDQVLKYQKSRRPSLVIIPDIANNIMIVDETNRVGIPVIGLVNSQCPLDIPYPIFANDQSIYSIHFFCHFLAALIAKEMVKTKHKLYTLPKNINNLIKKDKKKDLNIDIESEKFNSKNQRFVFTNYFTNKFVLKKKKSNAYLRAFQCDYRFEHYNQFLGLISQNKN
jgi:Ribosomal protein S2